MCRYATTYKHHYVCLPCRVSFKYLWDARGHRCPHCAEPMIHAGFDLAVPPRRDRAGWRTLEATLRSGLRFFSCGCAGPGFRPRDWSEVRERRVAAERLGLTEAEAFERRDPWSS